MQGMRWDTRGLAKLAATIILAVVSALIGHSHGGRYRTDAPLPGEVRGAAKPIDGDSLFVGRDEVRLKGIDAPEGRQTCTREGAPWDCGNAARDALRRLIGNDAVSCRVAERDKHGRLLAYCTAGGRDLNSGMVSSGFAVAYGGFEREQGEARRGRRGVWAGEFENPRDWRHERGIGL